MSKYFWCHHRESSLSPSVWKVKKMAVSYQTLEIKINKKLSPHTSELKKCFQKYTWLKLFSRMKFGNFKKPIASEGYCPVCQWFLSFTVAFASSLPCVTGCFICDLRTKFSDVLKFVFLCKHFSFDSPTRFLYFWRLELPSCSFVL